MGIKCEGSRRFINNSSGTFQINHHGLHFLILKKNNSALVKVAARHGFVRYCYHFDL